MDDKALDLSLPMRRNTREHGPSDIKRKRSNADICQSMRTKILSAQGLNDFNNQSFCRPADIFTLTPLDGDTEVRYSPPSEFLPVVKVFGDVSVTLSDPELWRNFSDCGTEMIINKQGRRMFPHLNVFVTGLDGNATYSVYLEITNTDDMRHKFVQNRWIPQSNGDAALSSHEYRHPDSPMKGNAWQKHIISFAKLKITNQKDSDINKILLQSMRKYTPHVIIVKHSDENEATEEKRSVFPFPETAFLAVTAYQNPQITKLKIRNNPFARAFKANNLAEHPKASHRQEKDLVVKDVRANALVVDSMEQAAERAVTAHPSACSAWSFPSGYSNSEELPINGGQIPMACQYQQDQLGFDPRYPIHPTSLYHLSYLAQFYGYDPRMAYISNPYDWGMQNMKGKYQWHSPVAWPSNETSKATKPTIGNLPANSKESDTKKLVEIKTEI